MSAAPPMIESLRVRGFRSLADIELSGLPPAAVLIGPNGSGKSNVLRFLDMLRPRRLRWFVEREGGRRRPAVRRRRKRRPDSGRDCPESRLWAVRLSLCPGMRPH